MSSSAGGAEGPIAQSIRSKLTSAFAPSVLSIKNDSNKHAHHREGSGGSETHFKVTIVSPSFAGKSLVARHRAVYGLLQDEIDAGVHALSIKAKTPEEVAKK